LPSRRVYIPKPDGRQRPLAVAALEDKIVQRAVGTLLNVIYEQDFLGISYGFRPGRGTHDALDALCVGIHSKKVSFILDADIRSFFDEISQEWLIRFLEHRTGDRRIIRLIQKWLKAGVLEDGVVSVSDRGTGQGSVHRCLPTSTCTTRREIEISRAETRAQNAGDRLNSRCKDSLNSS
jgi:RNA-directed DNA polymerase